MLPTDWSAPSASALQRLDDPRVRQFWDPNHMVAVAIKKAQQAGQRHPDCCERKGFLWDLTATYDPGAEWRDNLPEPILLNGPVVETVSDLDTAVVKVSTPSP
jgi:hypothetical protein